MIGIKLYISAGAVSRGIDLDMRQVIMRPRENDGWGVAVSVLGRYAESKDGAKQEKQAMFSIVGNMVHAMLLERRSGLSAARKERNQLSETLYLPFLVVHMLAHNRVVFLGF